MASTSTGSSTPHGGGKYGTLLDEAIWEMDGEDGIADDFIGSSSEPPYTYAALVRNGNEIANYLSERLRNQPPSLRDKSLTESDIDFLRSKGSAGVIMFEDSQGFVQVVYYDNAADLDADWAETEDKLSVEE